MDVSAEINQWGVGHGGFHTGVVTCSVEEGDTTTLNYVFDCGSTSLGVLRSRLRQYVNCLKRSGTPRIDALYISHFDSDHVNGLPTLSEILKPEISIDRIWVPFLTPAQKLALLATQSGVLSRAYIDLVLDPTETLGKLFEGVEVGLLKPDDEESREQSDEPIPNNVQEVASSNPDDPQIRISHGNVSITGVADKSRPSGERTLWELIPFVQPIVHDKAESFWKHAQSDGQMPGLSTEPVPSPGDIELILTSYRKQARDLARRVLGTDGSNKSSIVLYSGPGASTLTWCCLIQDRPYVPDVGMIWGSHQAPGPGLDRAGAWLSTGDARLEHSDSVKRLLDRLGQARAERVTVIAAPHHGSKNNSGYELWHAFPSARFVSIHAGGSAHHPHRDVKREIRRSHLRLFIVTDSSDDLTLLFDGN